MDYTSEIVELYSHTSYLEPKQFQIDIMNSIMNNIDLGKKMQAIKMPNTTGKTIMCNLLAVLLTRKGYKVVIYDPSASGRISKRKNKKFFYGSFHAEKYFDEIFCKEHQKILCVGDKDIEHVRKEDVDIFITDALGSTLDPSIDIRHIEKYIHNDLPDNEMSLAQRKLKSILHIQRLVKDKPDISVVSFEAGKSAIESGFTPIIATDYITCFGISDLDYEQLDSVANEYLMTYNQLIKKKLDNIINVKTKTIEEKKANQVDCAISDDLSDMRKALSSIEIMLSDKQSDNLKSDMTNIKTSLIHLSEDIGNIQGKVDIIANDVVDIKSIVISMNKMITERKEFMDMYFSVHAEDDEEADMMISKFTTMIAEQVINQGIGIYSKEEFKRMEKILQLSLGKECWEKMSLESRRFLTTAKYTLFEQITLDDLGDFSGVCVLASKAFEVEMAKRFIVEYKAYITNDLELGNQYEKKWPGALLKKVKGGIVPKDVEDFTLGDCKGIMGLRIESEPYRKNNNNLFISYCKNKLLGINNEAEIKRKLREYTEMIQNVKDRFRNPASHKKPVELTLAKECIDYIVEVERVLGVILTDFKF